LAALHLIYKRDTGNNTTHIEMSDKVSTRDLFASHPVFSLDEAARTLGPRGGRTATVDRLKHHVKTGRLTVVARGIYAVVPPGSSAERMAVDPILVALAARPDAVLSHHTALELLGAGHSAWHQCTAYTTRLRRHVNLRDATVLFLTDPKGFRGDTHRRFATRRVERLGQVVELTGPERTLVEGFRRPGLVGGLEELVASASGFPSLDVELLVTVLRRYGAANLWSAVGWFLERYQQHFHVSAKTLARCERHRPGSPQYLERGSRGGVFAGRWNLILPHALAGVGEPDER
jgi:predicted transcriptional regulator of viral defense system